MRKVIGLMLAVLLTLSLLCAPALAAGKTTITLSHTGTVTLTLGQTVQITATVSPAAPVTWTSKKPKVATVDGSGKITPVAEGKTKITVTTHNKKKATIAVTVVDPYKPTGVTLSQGKAATLTAGQSLQLNAALAPSTAKAKLVWKSSKPKVATVDGNGKVTAVGKGKAKITVQAENNKKAKAVITFTVNGGDQSGVVDPNKDLLNYLGKNCTTIAKQISFNTLIPYGSSANFGYRKGNARLDARGSYKYGLVEGGWIGGKSDYNIAGVTYGMSKSDAISALTKAGYKEQKTSINGGNWVAYEKPYRDEYIAVDVEYKNGKVTQVSALFVGVFPWDDDGYLGL